MKIYKLILLLSLISITSFAQQLKVHFDEEKWTEYIEGDMPLVISVPHGGRVSPEGMPVRSCKDAVTIVDEYTIELARELQKEIKQKYGLTPHIIISHLARKHIDHNRAIDKDVATCGNKELEKTWHTFHNYIDTAIKIAEKKYKKVVYIDLHGHGHAIKRLELGYILRTDALKAIEADEAEKIKDAKKSSLQNLLNADKNLMLKDLLFGENAFGTLMANEGIPATPSKQDPYPKEGEPFLSRGDNTIKFTGPAYPNVFGVQIECDRDVRVKQGRAKFAEAFVVAMVKYMERFANVKVSDIK